MTVSAQALGKLVLELLTDLLDLCLDSGDFYLSLCLCCGLYCAVLTEYRIKGEMRKAGWFSQERSVKEREGVWWNVVVVTPDQWLHTKGSRSSCLDHNMS